MKGYVSVLNLVSYRKCRNILVFNNQNKKYEQTQTNSNKGKDF